MSKLGTDIFLCQLLPTTYGLQQFEKIGAEKVDYFDFPGEIFEKFDFFVFFQFFLLKLVYF